MPMGFPVQLSDNIPTTPSGNGAAGTSPAASRSDHVHPVMHSSASGALNGSGEATITFSRSFSQPPALSWMCEELADLQPCILKRKSWVMTGGLYTGVVVKGYRLRKLPAVIGLLSALLNYDIAAGDAAGVSFDLTATQVT